MMEARRISSRSTQERDCGAGACSLGGLSRRHQLVDARARCGVGAVREQELDRAHVPAGM
jgi:hypothetical protein